MQQYYFVRYLYVCMRNFCNVLCVLCVCSFRVFRFGPKPNTDRFIWFAFSSVSLYWILRYFDIIESFFYSFMTPFTSYFISLRRLFEYIKLSLVKKKEEILRECMLDERLVTIGKISIFCIGWWASKIYIYLH